MPCATTRREAMQLLNNRALGLGRWRGCRRQTPLHRGDDSDIGSGVHRSKVVYEQFGIQHMRWRLQTHGARDIRYKSVAVIEDGVPQGRTRLELLDGGHNLPVFGLAQFDAIAGRYVL